MKHNPNGTKLSIVLLCSYLLFTYTSVLRRTAVFLSLAGNHNCLLALYPFLLQSTMYICLYAGHPIFLTINYIAAMQVILSLDQIIKPQYLP